MTMAHLYMSSVLVPCGGECGLLVQSDSRERRWRKFSFGGTVGMIAKNAFAKVLIIDGLPEGGRATGYPDGFDPGIRPVSGSRCSLYAFSRILRSANRIQHRTEPQKRVGL